MDLVTSIDIHRDVMWDVNENEAKFYDGRRTSTPVLQDLSGRKIFGTIRRMIAINM